MKETVEFIKKLWNNKRTRALAILIIYIIFFIIVFSLIGNSKPLPKPNNPSDKILTVNIKSIDFKGDYSFKVINDNIIYNDISYNMNEKPLELSNYDISIFTTNNIYNLINSSTLESKNYIDNSSTYLISYKDFEKIIYNNDIDSNLNVRITLNLEKLDYIKIDLKEPYGYETIIELGS